MNFAYNLPINGTSFGQISTAILRETYRRNISPPVFLIGGVDLSSQKEDADFNAWLQTCVNKSFKVHNKNNPTIKLWHTNFDSLASFSNDEIFITFLEVDAISDIEQNILRNKKTVFVTSNFLKQVCEDYGLSNVKYLQIGFDSDNFRVTNKKYFDDDRIVFSLLGKWELRKGHRKVIKAWIKKFGIPFTGERPKYFLQCSVYNGFLIRETNGQRVDENPNIWNEALEGKKYSNINFLPWTTKNDQYNELLNSSNIVIGMSGGENLGIPEMQSVALGKHAIILNCNGYKDWANNENSVLVNPSGKFIADDGVFFRKGGPLQQGNFFDFNEDEFIFACEEAIKRVKNNRINVSGLELQKRTYKETVDTLLNELV